MIWSLFLSRVMLRLFFEKIFAHSFKLHGSLNAGGAYRDRTDDLLNAIQALSQLS